MKHLFVLAATLFCIVITWYQSSLSSTAWVVMLLALLLTVLLPITSSQYLYNGTRKNLAATLGIVAMMCVLVLTADNAAASGMWYGSDTVEPASCVGTSNMLQVEGRCGSMNIQTSSDSGIFTAASNLFLVVIFLSIVNLGLVIVHFIQRKKSASPNAKSFQKFVQSSKLFWLVVGVISVGISMLTLFVPTPDFMQSDEPRLATQYYGIPYPAREVVQSGYEYPCVNCNVVQPFGSYPVVSSEVQYNEVALFVNAVFWLGLGSLIGFLARQGYK